MAKAASALLHMALAALASFAVPSLARAEAEPTRVFSGACQYPERVARYRFETTLVVCDTASVKRDGSAATLEFSRRSWGPSARFTGEMQRDTMAVTAITLRTGGSVAASGTCEIFRRADGEPSVISCLAKAGSRPVAVNFVASRL